MAPDPATGKSRGSRYRSNDAQYRSGEGSERDSQRPEMGGKGKGDKESGGTDSGRGVKRRQHGSGGVDGGSVGATSASATAPHRSSKRWRGDGSEASDSVVPADRWDGGAPDPVKESTSSLGKSKQEIDAKVGDGSSGKSTVTPGKEGMNTEKVARKQRILRASLASDSRAITVMDLQETDVSIIDSNIRIKNKVSYRREIAADITELEVEKGVKENVKSTAEMRGRRRWDRDGLKSGAEEVEDGPGRGIVGSEGSLERDKKKEKAVVKDRGDAEGMRVVNGRKLGDGTRDLVLEAGSRPDVSDDNDQRTNEWKIQEDLRNVELEKELENRIRRRREESGDRDRWRDDDRERDVKRHSDPREDRTRDERHREDYSRRDRERHSDRHESRQNREGSRPSESKPRDDRHYESDREYRSHREERQCRGRSKDLDDQGRGDRAREQDHRDRKGRDKVSNHDMERRVRDKGYKDDASERERPHSSAAYGESVERSEHRQKRAREGDGVEGFAMEREQSRQGRASEPDTPGANDYAHDDRSRRSRDERDADCRPERVRVSPRDSDSMRAKVRSNHWRNDGHASELNLEGHPSPRQDTRASPSSNRMDYPSPPRLDDRKSPRYVSQRSPSSPHLDVTTGPSRGRGAHGDWFEPSNSVSSSSGTQRRPPGASLHMSDRRDRMKWLSGTEEEVKSGMHRSNRSMDEVRDGSLSPHRLRDQHMLGALVKPLLHGQDTFSRGPMIGRGDRERWRGSTQGGSIPYDGGQLDHHIPDDLSPRDRNDRGRRMPMNRPPGSPMLRPQLASLPVPPLAPLPPPPPFRPGIDNPAVLGPPNGGFDDGTCSRDQGRVDRKGGPLRREGGGAGLGPGDAWRGVNMGNWNSRNQGPLPGNGFPPFPPQFAPHPSAAGGGFPGLGQQFPVPPIFPGGGGRPPMDMGFGGRFMGPGGHMGDSGDGFLGPGRGAGWHGPGEGDDGRGPPLMGPVDGWEGPGPHGDDRHRHGRMEWERGGHMGVRVWERERERELWEGRVREGAADFMPLRSQMEPPLQNTAFAPGGSGWGMPREPQGLNDLKPRPERPPYDIQESKRKPDGVPQKMQTAKSSGKTQVLSEGKRNKYAAAAMESILTQLHISPELAGLDLYNKYRALLPVLDSDKQMQGAEEVAGSDSVDDDLSMEVDIEGEALISAPQLLPKLLPPLPEGVFEAAMRVYRRPERENKLQRSTVGSFVMPFDPATIKLPSIKMELRSGLSVVAEDQPLAVDTLLLSQQQDDMDALGTQQGTDNPDAGTRANIPVASMEEVVEDQSSGLDARFEPSDNEVSEFEYKERNTDVASDVQKRKLVEYMNKNGDAMLYKVNESVVAEFRGREGDAIEEEFLPSHVEVAEYSDREFETEMEDTLEEVQQGVAGGEETRQNSEVVEMEEGQQGGSVVEGSNLQNSVYMHVEEVQLGSAGAEEVQNGDVCTEAGEGLRGDTGGGGSGAGNNLYLETGVVLGEHAVGVESRPGKFLLRGASEVQRGDAVDNIVPEAEDGQGAVNVTSEGGVDKNVIRRLEDQQGEVTEETKFEGNLSLETEAIKREDTATVVTCESDFSLDVEEASDVANDGGQMLEPPPVILNEVKGPSAEAESSRYEEEATSIADHEVMVYPRTYSLEIVNSLVVERSDGALDCVDSVKPEEDAVLVEEEQVVGEEGKIELDVVPTSEVGVASSAFEETYDRQSADKTGIELLPDSTVSEDVKEVVGHTSVCEENVDTMRTLMVQVLDRNAGVSEVMVATSGGGRGSDDSRLNRDGADERSQLLEQYDDMQLSDNERVTDLTEAIPSDVVDPEHRVESNGKLKEIEEEKTSAQEQEPPVTVVEVQEPHPRQLRKRRASSRLLANAEAHAQQEAPQGQGSVGVKSRAGKGAGKRAAKGTTRTSQRRSKRRGSTH